MLFFYISVTLIFIVLLIGVFKLVAVESKVNRIKENMHQIDWSNRLSKLDGVGSSKLEEIKSKFYAVCVCQRSNKQRTYLSFTTDDPIEGDPTEDDIANLRSRVLGSDPDFKSCEVIFFGRLKG